MAGERQVSGRGGSRLAGLKRKKNEIQISERKRRKKLAVAFTTRFRRRRRSAVSFFFLPVMLSAVSSLLRARVGSNNFYQKEELVLEALSAEIVRLEVHMGERTAPQTSFVSFSTHARGRLSTSSTTTKKTRKLRNRPASPSAPSASRPGPPQSAPTASPGSSSRPPWLPRRPERPRDPSPPGNTSGESCHCSSSLSSRSRLSPWFAPSSRRPRPSTRSD